MKEGTLQIFDRRSPVGVLGPYQRVVVWVQGCKFACKNCIVPESWDEYGGEAIQLSELIDWILSQKGIEGVTFSGGEPMLQASALVEVIDSIRLKKDLGTMCYTGFSLEYLKHHGNSSQKALLNRLDLLVDGKYVEKLHGNFLWRGSSNQRLIMLTERYKEFLQEQQDRSAGLEFFIKESLEVGFSGVPNQSNFRQDFESRMRQKSIVINPK